MTRKNPQARLKQVLAKVEELQQEARPHLTSAPRAIRDQWELFQDRLYGAALYARWRLSDDAIDDLEKIWRDARQFRGTAGRIIGT